MLGPIANEFQSIVTLEDTLLRALAGYKLVCELLQKSLGLWIADPKESKGHFMVVLGSFLLPSTNSKDEQFRVEYIEKAGLSPPKYEGLLQKMRTASTSKREVRERDASWQPYYHCLGFV